MSPNGTSQNRQTIAEQASHWLVMMEDDAVTPSMQQAFEDWLNADPEHKRVYRLQQAAWSALPDMTHLAALKEDTPQPSPSEQSFWMRAMGPLSGRALPAGAVAALALIVTVGVWTVNSDVWTPETSEVPMQTLASVEERPLSDYATAVAETRDITLEDGSRLTLGARSSVDVVFGADERRVTLLEGEVFFDVASDAERPFIVVADQAEIRVVGTRFNVRRAADTVFVAVEEGEVAVLDPGVDAGPDEPSPQSAVRPETLLPGDQASITTAVTRLASVAVEDIASWREGRLVYVNASLSEVIADADRYWTGQIRIEDGAARELELTASFRTDEVEAMLDVLAVSLPVEIDRSAPDLISIRSTVEAG